jgi:hypothetical protein
VYYALAKAKMLKVSEEVHRRIMMIAMQEWTDERARMTQNEVMEMLLKMYENKHTEKKRARGV